MMTPTDLRRVMVSLWESPTGDVLDAECEKAIQRYNDVLDTLPKGLTVEQMGAQALELTASKRAIRDLVRYLKAIAYPTE